MLDPKFQTPFANPSALDFLQNYQHWRLRGRKVSHFFEKVLLHQKEDLFRKTGGHTFFIPVDYEEYDRRLEDVDGYRIDGHVVPNLVLFTRPSRKNFVYQTSCNGDDIHIVVILLSLKNKLFVRSYTVHGDGDHPKGEVLAEIVQADIPVTNGVVHLISRPLAIAKTPRLFPYLSVLYKVTSDPFLNTTFHIGEKGPINQILELENNVFTYFAPRDQSWSEYLGYSDDELVEVLSRHVVVSTGRHTMSSLAASSARNNGTPLESLAGTLDLQILHTNNTFFVVYGDKPIRVSRADYHCSDGIVHVIDGVFAAPKPPPESPFGDR